jgi:inositol-1,4,5-trisphosphate 5-phosphatase
MDKSNCRDQDVSNNNVNYHHHHYNNAPNQDSTSPPKCFIEFLPQNMVQLNKFRRILTELHGFLGLIAIKGTIYVGFINGKSNVGPLIPNVNVCQLINTIFVNFSGEVFSLANQLNFGPSQLNQPLQHLQQFEDSYENLEASSSTSKITSIMKLLETGTFYYSYNTDLAVKSQDWDLTNKNEYSYTTVENLQDDYAGRFVWNVNLLNELSTFRNRLCNEEKKNFDQGKFYITLIRGFVRRESINSNGTNWITIISRQDSRKIGSLFGPACMDDEGNVANFVETEILVYTGQSLVSFTLIKGNVPLFWKLDSHLLSTKIEFPRSLDASKHAFNRFFETLCIEYKMIFVLDALSLKGNQPELSERYANAIMELQRDRKELCVAYKRLTQPGSFGLSNKLKGKNDYISLLLQDENILTALSNYSANQFDFTQEKHVSRQTGSFMVNTLDSNDRANHLECKISEMVLENLFGSNFNSEIWSKHNILWYSNGTALGRLSDTYNASIKTKNKTGGLIGKVAEQGKKYAGQSRKYVVGTNNISATSSTGRQTQFDKLLGRKNKEVQVELIDPIHDHVLQGLNNRRDEFTSLKNLHIYAITYNVNAILYDGNLKDLLFPEESFSAYDLIAIALEEVIELTPSKTMSIDLRTRNFWERKFKETLNAEHSKKYTLLRGEQLGGVLLLVYASTKTIDNIKHVETSVKKTGFKGMSANKGGVAITFTFSTHSRICFVASHLAAGQSNSEERHQNYKTIVNGLTFKKCKNIKDSDILIWMGDLNYRISLPNKTVRKMLHYKPPYVLNTASNNLSTESFISGDGYISSSDLENGSLLEEMEANGGDRAKSILEQEREFESENEHELQEKIQIEHKLQSNIEDMGNLTVTAKNLSNPSLFVNNSGSLDSVNLTDDKTLKKNQILSSSSVNLARKQNDNENKLKTENKNKIYGTSQEKLNNTSSTQLSIGEEDRTIEQLFEYDQLNYQMSRGQTFPFFDEMEIHFKPTYKFDKGTDYYDTSEKQRVPSWTDRILTYVKNKKATYLEQLRYNSIPKYKFSDHKPVYGIFLAKLEIVNDSIKSKIEKELYDITKQQLYANDTGGILTPGVLNLLLDESRFNKVLKKRLPAPSSKVSRWWIAKDKDGASTDEKLGKVKIRFPELDSGEYIINPKLPTNPFIEYDQPRFILRNGI